MKALRLATAFTRDLKRIERRGCDRALLDAVVDTLRKDEQLPRAATTPSRVSGKAGASATCSPTGS
jgi:mRNA-degrading endonuclease YafQ of YafQ-DinJ toxin-antitoxin module